MNKDEALKLALEALEFYYDMHEEEADAKAITAIKEALANEALEKKAENARELGLDYEPEPWEKFCDSTCVWTDHHPDCKLSQRTWVGLTDEEIKTIEEMALTKRMAIEMAIAIVKEKNT